MMIYFSIDMKQHIFVKQSPLIQLAHLYEHIVCIELTKLLAKKNLYIYLDYNIVAKTYHGGLVYLEITMYTNKRLDMRKILSNLNISFDENIINLGLSQLIAEHGAILAVKDIETIADELEKLHQNPWTAIDDLGIIDASNFRQKKYPLYITDGKLPKTNKLNLSVVFNHTTNDNKSIQLTPLFKQLSYLIMSNLEELICNEFGYFGASNSFKTDKNTSKLTHTLQVGLSEVNLKDYIKIAQDLIKSMTVDKAFDKFERQLRSISYSKNPDNSVNFEKNYEDTLIFIGSKGWKLIATSENINYLLKNTSFEFSYGKQKEMISLQ
jgi:hypothetical protein